MANRHEPNSTQHISRLLAVRKVINHNNLDDEGLDVVQDEEDDEDYVVDQHQMLKFVSKRSIGGRRH